MIERTKIEKISKSSALKATVIGAVARYYKILSLTVFIIILGLSYWLLLKPRYIEVGQGGQFNLETLRAERELRQAHLSQLEVLVAEMEKISQSDIATLQQILPDEQGIADLFVQAQAIAEQNGFLLNSVSFTEVGNKKTTKTVGGIRRLNVTMDLFGLGYPNLKRLLQSYEDNLRLFDVNAVYFTPGSPSFAINLFTYYFPDSSAASPTQ